MKKWVICLASMLYLVSWVMILKLSKKVYFLQFCADLGQKPKSVKAIYIYISEKSLYRPPENVLVYGSLSHRSWGISNYNIKKDADSAEIYQNSSISNTNIFKTLSHSIINNTIFLKRVSRPFRCIRKLLYLDSFAEVSTKLKKCNFFENLRIITQEENMETTKTTPFFSSTFLTFSTCLYYSFLDWKILNIHFQIHYFGLFWSVKYLNFLPKTSDSDSISYFSRK